MKMSDIIDLINELEDKFPVDQWIVEGIHIWPFVRIQICADISYARSAGSPPYNYKKNGKFPVFCAADKILQRLVYLTRFLYAYIIDFKHNSKITENVDIILLGDDVSKEYMQGAWYDKFHDPLKTCFNQMNRSCLRLERGNRYFIPRDTPSMFIQPHLDYLTIKNLMISMIYNFKDEKLDYFKDFILFLTSKNLNIPMPDIGKIRTQVLRILSMALYYENLFKKVKPSIGFLVSYYNDYGMAFNLACRRYGIPAVDIQHGSIQVDLNPAYGRWNNTPVRGYELLPSIFWVWGKSEEEAISSWSKDVSDWHQPIVGGNVLLMFREQNNEAFTTYYDEKIADVKQRYSNSANILLTLQSGLAEYENLKHLIYGIKNTQLSYLWWIRLHPGMTDQKNKIKDLLRHNGIQRFELDTATDVPLYALLPNMDLHVTHSSSTVLEARLFGVPSVVTNEFGAEPFKEQISSGWTLLACTADEIITGIETQLKKRIALEKTAKIQNEPDKNINDILLYLLKKKHD